MAVRRLHPEQPARFEFTPENLAFVRETVAKYPAGKQASAVIPVLWRAQEQNGGWVTEPMLRTVAELLGMATIRVYEIATFYTQFQLAPVGRKAHVQVCGTTPCMLRGAQDIVGVCERRIAETAHTLSADGDFSWEEVECLGSCANAPMVLIDKDTYEDLTVESFERLLDGFERGTPPKPGSQTGRIASCPDSGATSLKDAQLYDGSRIGAWKKRFHTEERPADAPAAPAPMPSAPASAAATPVAEAKAFPAVHPAALAAMANAGIVKELEARGSGGAAMPAGELAKLVEQSRRDGPAAFGAKSEAAPSPGAAEEASKEPPLLTQPRDGKADDLKLIWGVAEKLEERMNALGIWHFDQVAAWSPEEVRWFEDRMPGFHGRIARDKWIEQCQKLMTGWRPESDAGDRPKA
ncbi:MAG: NADH-quinone oxidoreductase subunit NuoE [Hyphomicrobium sp.]|nr:NADH-quinone oxidoreductase subunit NuoE [Hyphomicrobium sp.]